MKHRLGFLLSLLVAGTLAGCSGSGSGSSGTRATATTAAPTTAAAAPAIDCGNPRASLRPVGPLPAPNQMPVGSYMEVIQKRGRLVVGASPDTLLFGSVNPFNAQFEGFDIDVVRELSKAIFGSPDKIEFHAVTNAQRIPLVRDGTVDLVAHTMTINCARRQVVDFSSVYFEAGQKVLVRKDSAAKSIDDLGGKKVCAPNGTTSLDNIAKVSSHPIPVGVADETDCLLAFQTGEVDAISTDDTVLEGMAAQDPFAKIVGERFSEEPYGLCVNLDHPEFTRFLNAVLDRMRADGTWALIYAHWLGRFGPTPEPPAALYRN